MMRTSALRRLCQLVIPLTQLLAGLPAAALGVDRLSVELDASSDFQSTERLVVFNSSSRPTYITAQALTWDVEVNGQFITKSTRDLSIKPSVIRVGPNGSAPFALRYQGPPLDGREATFRVQFAGIPVPDRSDGGGPGTAGMDVSTVFTVPVYVTDHAQKSEVLQDIKASFTVSDGKARLRVSNSGDRHVRITEARINGEPGRALGPVLAQRERVFELPAPTQVERIDVLLAQGESTRTLQANQEP